MCLGSGVYKSCLFSSMWSGLLVIPGVSTLPCLPLMLSLKTIILKYFLVCVFLISPCCVHRNRRPDQNSKRRPFTSFCFVRFFKCVSLFLCFCPSCSRFAGVYAAVRGSPIPRFAGLLAAVRGSAIPPFAGVDAAVRGSAHPAVRGEFMPRSRINQPSVHWRWRHHPRLTLARRPASDSMPAGLPLTQCPPACLWFQLARSAADSSSPDCRWLKLAGLPLTHATGRRQGRPTHHCLFHAAVRGPPLFHVLLYAGKANPPSADTRPAAGWGSLQPAGPCRCVVKPAGCCHYLSSQPDYGIPRRPLPYWQGQPAVAVFDQTVTHGLFNCLCVFSPGGLLIPLSFPKEILGGGSRAPAEETEVGAGAAVSEAVPPWPPELPAPPWPPELPAPPWPPELPAPPWPPELPAPPWPPELPAPPWPPELPAPPGPRSVCSTLETPFCVCICVGPVGSPECPPPLPGSTVTARDVPSGRGELC